jgi:hypothetical protein
VRIFSRSHSPPPSTTGMIWSASHRLFLPAAPRRSPHSSRAFRPAAPRNRFRCFQADTQSTPHCAQTPRSRSSTFSRMYPVSVRNRHSSTHQSEQNVSRPLGTSRLHQRHRFRPFIPLGRRLRSAHPPGIVRMVLMDRLCSWAGGGCQRVRLEKITFFDAFWVVRKEQEYTGRHLTLRELAAQPGFGYTPQLHQLQV